MERFKIDNFEREHGIGSFPAFKLLDRIETEHLFVALKGQLGLSENSSAQAVLQVIDQVSLEMEGIDATDESFNLREVLCRLRFSAKHVLLNWHRFDAIDDLSTDSLCNFFGDIFYPSADDLDILDPELTWLLSIRHYGAVKALVLPVGKAARWQLGA